MHAPQIIWILLISINLLATARLHGEEKTGEYNFFASLIGAGITFWILYAGGFFN